MAGVHKGKIWELQDITQQLLNIPRNEPMFKGMIIPNTSLIVI